MITRYNLKDEKYIKEFIFYNASNISKEMTYNALKNVIGVKNVSTITSYAKYVENVYLIFFLPQYHRSLKKQLLAPKKVYIIDNALAYQIGFRCDDEKTRMLENLVFIELKRRGHEIYYYKEKGECDFIIKTGNQITQAIQVCFNMDAASTRTREYKGLYEAMHDHGLDQGLILTLDEEREEIIEHSKIKILPIWKWLLSYLRF